VEPYVAEALYLELLRLAPDDFPLERSEQPAAAATHTTVREANKQANRDEPPRPEGRKDKRRNS
jgi:hypothetical protein